MKQSWTWVSRETGIKQQTLNQQINRDTYPDIEQAHKICSLFDISMEYFTTGKERNLSYSTKALEIARAADNLSDDGKDTALHLVISLEEKFPLDLSDSTREAK